MFKRDWILPGLAFISVTALAEIGCRLGHLPAYLFASPSSVFTSMFVDWSSYELGIVSTLKSSFLGWLFAVLVGLFFGSLCSLSKTLKGLVYPVVLFFQTVPIVAIAPILIIWFGHGEPTSMASSFIVALFPVVASTLAGLTAVSEQKKELFNIYSATRVQRFWYLELPTSIPFVFAGLQMAAGLAVVGALVGEFVGGGGLGGVIDAALAQQRLDLVFGAVFFATFLGLIFTQIIEFLRYLLKCWRPFFNNN